MYHFATPVLTAKFTAALKKSHVVANKVEVWNGNVKLALLGNMTAGKVSVDETRSVRRQCQLTIVSRGLEYDDLVPTNKTGLLHPSTGNELRVYRGIDFRDGTTPAYVPLGVFRMSKPVVKDTGDSINIQVTGLDRSALVARIKWLTPYVIAAGTDLATAIKTAMATRLPAYLKQAYQFTPTNPVPFSNPSASLTVAAQTFGTTPAKTNTPWTDLAKLATTGGMELLFDVMANCVLRPTAVVTPTTGIPQPTLGPIVAQFIEGDGCIVTEVDRTFDETAQYNGVKCIGNGTGGTPVSYTVWTITPSSPVYYTPTHASASTWGPTPYIFETSAFPAPGQTSAQAQAQAKAAAMAKFILVVKALDETTFKAIVDPRIQEGDSIQLQRARIGVTSDYVVSTLTIPMDSTSLMTVTNRPRQVVP